MQQDLDGSHSPTPDAAALRHACLPPKFAFGQVVGTPAALALLGQAGVDAFALLERHGRGDWGDIEESDRKANDEALIAGERLLSAYDLPGDAGRVWIITEWDRSATTILLPSDY